MTEVLLTLDLMEVLLALLTVTSAADSFSAFLSDALELDLDFTEALLAFDLRDNLLELLFAPFK